ncbi:MAG TPA: hypothetical protein VKS25_16555 [Solirubrobacteraceae bacterium]|nr:hypothetical protein [Solirubrobacteraceae bacterium]
MASTIEPKKPTRVGGGRRRMQAAPVTVRRADGSVEVVPQSRFDREAERARLLRLQQALMAEKL